MAKRFTDTEKWNDPWYSDMPQNFKLAYQIMLDMCDNVGVWKVNKRIVNFHLGEEIDWDMFVSYMGKRLYIINDEKWWITKFCDFQYGELLEGTKSKPHQAYINQLKKHTLWIPYTRGIYTPKEKEKEKDKEKDKEKEKEYTNIFNIIWENYPRKESKGYAYKSWEKIKDKKTVCEKILSALKWQKDSPSWKKDGGQYIPLLSSYLNGKKWEDQKFGLFKPSAEEHSVR